MRSTFPSRSPTTTSICAAAMRRRAMPACYGQGPTALHWRAVSDSGAMTWRSDPGIEGDVAPRRVAIEVTELASLRPELLARIGDESGFADALFGVLAASRSL